VCLCEVPQISELSRLQVHLKNNKKQKHVGQGNEMGAEQSRTGLEGALEHQGTCVCQATKNPVQPAPTRNAVRW